MPDVSRELAEHSSDVSKTAKSVKQKLRRFAKDRKEVIRVEIIKLLAVGSIRECKNPIWLANPVLVPKKTGQWRMCIDYTDLNRHCPKDPVPLLRIDQVVDSTAGSVLLCFLDCYSGYHQIALKVSDQDKTTFIMPHDIYCYTAMTFGLKNAAATYQKAIQKCLESQIGRTLKPTSKTWSSRPPLRMTSSLTSPRLSTTFGTTTGSSTRRSASSASRRASS
jgi:hypothetical protein